MLIVSTVGVCGGGHAPISATPTTGIGSTGRAGVRPPGRSPTAGPESSRAGVRPPGRAGESGPPAGRRAGENRAAAGESDRQPGRAGEEFPIYFSGRKPLPRNGLGANPYKFCNSSGPNWLTFSLRDVALYCPNETRENKGPKNDDCNG